MKFYKLRCCIAIFSIIICAAAVVGMGQLRYIFSAGIDSIFTTARDNYIAVNLAVAKEDIAMAKRWLSFDNYDKMWQFYNTGYQIYPFISFASTKTTADRHYSVIGIPTDALVKLDLIPEGLVIVNEPAIVLGARVEPIELDELKLFGKYYAVARRASNFADSYILDFTPDFSIFMPLSDAMRNSDVEYFSSFVICGSKINIQHVKLIMQHILPHSRIFIKDTTTMESALKPAKAKVQSLFSLVAVVAIILSVIALFNIWVVILHERQQEIGLRLCVGATIFDLMRQFAVESMIFGSIGGVLGIVVGNICAYIIVVKFKLAYYFYILPSLMGILVVGALVLSMIVLACRLAMKKNITNLLESA